MKKSVFFIDDDDSFIFILNRCASKMVEISKVYSAKNGRDALDQLIFWKNDGAELPNVMFVDINMPVMDGFEFLNEFKKLCENFEEFKAIVPIVMLTSSEQEMDKDKANATGIVKKYIIKPAGIDKIARILLETIQ